MTGLRTLARSWRVCVIRFPLPACVDCGLADRLRHQLAVLRRQLDAGYERVSAEVDVRYVPVRPEQAILAGHEGIGILDSVAGPEQGRQQRMSPEQADQ